MDEVKQVDWLGQGFQRGSKARDYDIRRHKDQTPQEEAPGQERRGVSGFGQAAHHDGVHAPRNRSRQREQVALGAKLDSGAAVIEQEHPGNRRREAREEAGFQTFSF